MGKASIIKGTGGEVEVVNLCKAHGLADARRTGMWKAHDILVTIGRKIWNVEVKRRKRCLEWIYKELEAGRDAVFVRADHRYWLTITRSKDFFALAAPARPASMDFPAGPSRGESDTVNIVPAVARDYPVRFVGNDGTSHLSRDGATPSPPLQFHEPLDEEAA